MAVRKTKTKAVEVLTFKADQSIVKLLKGVPNRSEFIRAAILEALDSVCPFCRGTGVLTPHRKKHWNDLNKHHHKKECKECHEEILVCS
jgi:hypothetical protein